MTGYDEHRIPTDRILTEEEGIAFKTQIADLTEAKRWRWTGIYATPETAANIANANPPQGAGEVVLAPNGGLLLFY